MRIANKLQRISRLKYVVCGTDHWMYPYIGRGRCTKCKREVCVDPLFEGVKVKYCPLCNPQLTELSKEEGTDDKGEQVVGV